jgi:hypothetical protein
MLLKLLLRWCLTFRLLLLLPLLPPAAAAALAGGSTPALKEGSFCI